MHVRAGVLDYTAVEGTVGMPPQVLRNLFGDGAAAAPPEGSRVTVSYRRLPKGGPQPRPSSERPSDASDLQLQMLFQSDDTSI